MRNFGLTSNSSLKGRLHPRLLETTPVNGRDTPVPLFTGGFSLDLAPDHTGSDQYPDHAGNENCVDHVRFLFAEDRKEAALLFAFKCGVMPVIVGAPLIIGWLLFFA